MTAQPGGPSALDQIVFRWSEQSLLGSRGLGPVASSLEPARLEVWEQRLKNLVWAAPEDGDALVYLEFGDEAAVVRREPDTDSTGRGTTAAHALVGPGLDPRLALGLARSEWDGWIGVERRLTDSRLPMVGGAELSDAAAAGISGPRGLRSAARELPAGPLAAAVAAVLGEPMAELTLVTPGLDHAELMFALLELLDGVIPGPYTFSTFQSTDNGAGLPRVVFLGGQPEFSLRTTTRLRLLLPATGGEQQPAADDLARFALTWCGFYQRRGVIALERLRPARPRRSADESVKWARSISLAEGVLADAVDLLHRIAEGVEFSAQEEAAIAKNLSNEAIADALAELPAQSLAELAAAWHVDSQAYARHRAIGVAIHNRLMTQLVSGWNPRDAEAVRDAVREPGLIGPWLKQRVQDFAAKPASAGRPDPTSGLTDMIAACRILGLGAPDQSELLGTLLAAARPDYVLSWINEHAHTHPAETAEVTARLPAREHTGSQRDRAVAADFARSRGLAVAIELMARSDPASALELSRRALRYFAGPSVNDPVYLSTLILPTDQQAPEPALLHALLNMVTEPKARGFVFRIVADEFFATHGLPATPSPQQRNSPPTRAQHSEVRQPVPQPQGAGSAAFRQPAAQPEDAWKRGRAGTDHPSERRDWGGLIMIASTVVVIVAVAAMLALIVLRPH